MSASDRFLGQKLLQGGEYDPSSRERPLSLSEVLISVETEDT